MDDERLVLCARRVRWAMTALHAIIRTVAFALGELVAAIDDQDGAPLTGSALVHQVDEAIGALDRAYNNLADILNPDMPASEGEIERI